MTIDGSCTRPLLVFLIDDEPAVAFVFAGILRKTGCLVKTFTSGSELIAFPSDTLPDAVVTDFMMQPIDGLKIAA